MTGFLFTMAALILLWAALMMATIPPGTGRHRRQPTTWDRITTWLNNPTLSNTARFLSIGGPA